MLSWALAIVSLIVLLAPLAYYKYYKRKKIDKRYDRLDQIYRSFSIGQDWSSIQSDKYIHETPRLMQ